jgi:hypothetical protein
VVHDEIGDLIRTEEVERNGGGQVLNQVAGQAWSRSRGEGVKSGHFMFGSSMVAKLLSFLHGTIVAFLCHVWQLFFLGTILTEERRQDCGLPYLNQEQLSRLLDERLQGANGKPLLSDEEKTLVHTRVGGHLRPVCDNLIPNVTCGVPVKGASVVFVCFDTWASSVYSSQAN